MDKNKYVDWYLDNLDDNAWDFSMEHEDMFEVYCLNKFDQLGVDRDE